MIFGNIDQLEEFPYLEEAVKECFEYVKSHDILSYERGCHEIDGDRLFVNVVEYLSLIHISEPTRRVDGSRMPSSA